MTEVMLAKITRCSCELEERGGARSRQKQGRLEPEPLTYFGESFHPSVEKSMSQWASEFRATGD